MLNPSLSTPHDVIRYRNSLEMSEPMILEMETWNHLNVNEEWLLQCCIKLMCTEWDCLNTFLSRCTALFRNWSYSQETMTLLKSYYPNFSDETIAIPYLNLLHDAVSLSCHQKSLMSPNVSAWMCFLKYFPRCTVCLRWMTSWNKCNVWVL